MTRFFNRKAGYLILAACLVSLTPAQAQQSHDHGHGMQIELDHGRRWATDAPLRESMQDMGKNMQGITDGISSEDWKMVAKLAPLIADHPQPPMAEKLRILSFLGSDAGKFKRHDETTYQAAQALEQAAASSDGKAVIQSFARVQESCLGCHQAFRKPFVEHFYGAR
ncbi:MULTISPECIES: cytochrome c [Gammaproteobacteria]|uniref:cytochrome c n=1 Tax=Gammaproteobacteria TaxID=1236 RepID=UPI0021C6D0C3|nr:cytochrome c [Pseudomonas aeruginosa]